MNNYLIQKQKIPSAKAIRSYFSSKPIKHVLFVYDRRLLNNSEFEHWVRQQKLTYELEGGERLKSLSAFTKHITTISELLENFSHRELGIVACGGGSVGDFVGFVASVYKRGIPLIHMPTTWLSAVDSSHGGKTALNLKDFKNQIGTFHSAEAVIVVKSLMMGVESSFDVSEWLKIGISSNAKMFLRLVKSSTNRESLLWSLLEDAVITKINLVRKDPFETKGSREILNLGHTLGHALELYYKESHGWSVAQGLYFSIEWSRHKGILTKAQFDQINAGLNTFFEKQKSSEGHSLKLVPQDELLRLLSQDKKKVSSTHTNFIFVERLGKAISQKISFSSLVKEAIRQKWSY